VCGSGCGPAVLPVVFFISFLVFVGRWSRVISVPVVAWRWSGAAPTWAVVKMVGCWLIGTLTPPNSVWGVVFWARGCEFPVNFAGTRGSSLEPALSSVWLVCLVGVLVLGSRSRSVVAVMSTSGGRSGPASDTDAQPLGSISTRRGRRQTVAFV